MTAGEKFTDIDAYAGCIAYAQLLRWLGEDAVAVLPGTLNSSVPEMVRGWKTEYLSDYHSQADDSFILVDISDSQAVANIVVLSRVIEVIDHHPDEDEYWHRHGVKTQIEPVGAACTQIYERWVEAGALADLPEVTARLLACGILDNTLNFHATVTTERDHEAYAALAAYGQLGTDWPEHYFSACESEIFSDPVGALVNDTKEMSLAGFPSALHIGQLMVWDAPRLIDLREVLEHQMSLHGGPWFVNLISVSEGKNYVFTPDLRLQQFLERVMHLQFVSGLAHSNRLWLRKEIIQAAIGASLKESVNHPHANEDRPE